MVITAQNSSPPYRIACLLIDGFALLSYSATIEPLRVANAISGRTLYEIYNMPVSGARATSSSGAEIRANAHIGERVDFDLVLVIAGGDPTAFDDARILQWLRHLSTREIRLGGISGGAVILATAGLMKGYRMTVHWQYLETLRAHRPTLAIEHSPYVIDRDRLTCEGGTAPFDMIKALVAQHHGNGFSNRISEWFRHQALTRDNEDTLNQGQRLSSTQYNTHNRSVLTAIERMADSLAEPLSLIELAEQLSLSPRQTNRLFHDHLQCSTMTFYRQLRLNKARQLLADSPLTITDIALATGFANSAHFSSAYRQQFDKKPSEERSLKQRD